MLNIFVSPFSPFGTFLSCKLVEFDINSLSLFKLIFLFLFLQPFLLSLLLVLIHFGLKLELFPGIPSSFLLSIKYLVSSFCFIFNDLIFFGKHTCSTIKSFPDHVDTLIIYLSVLICFVLFLLVDI